jgi:hypothetical protein
VKPYPAVARCPGRILAAANELAMGKRAPLFVSNVARKQKLHISGGPPSFHDFLKKKKHIFRKNIEKTFVCFSKIFDLPGLNPGLNRPVGRLPAGPPKHGTTETVHKPD